MAGMEFRILGRLEVIGPHGPIAIGSGRQRAILALLVLHLGETVSVDRLIDEVWGDDPPPSAQHALEVHVSGLRRALGPDRIETQPGGYRLSPQGSRVDLRRFEALVADGSTASADGDAEAAATRYAAALALWRGPALTDLSAGPIARATATRLDELRAVVLERRIDADLACGRHLRLIPELRSIVAETPLSEAFQARLMLALYRSGRQADALAAYRTARETLDRELGVEPGPELEAMQLAVLNHYPILDVVNKPGQGILPATSAPPGPDRRRERHGAGLQADRGRRGSRRTVTILMADLVGSTLLGEPLDPETARGPLERSFDEIETVLERHGGTVERVVGDAVIAVFGQPVTREDDALRAVRAESEMRVALGTLNEDLERHLRLRVEMRIGLNTGEVLVQRSGDRATPASGHAVNIAGRLEQAAAPGEILLGERTQHLVRDAVEVGRAESIELKGRAEPIIAYRLEQVAGQHGHRRRLDGPMVGRELELEALRQVFGRAVSSASCQLVTILGPAGVGKSRVVAEFLEEVQDRARVLRGRCLPYGEGITYWPVADVVRQAAGITELDSAESARARIGVFVAGLPEAAAIARGLAGVIGLDVAVSQDDLFWAFRRAMEHVADERPLVILVEDIHWAESTLVELLESLVSGARGSRMLVVCPARPELLDERQAPGHKDAFGTVMLLEPLSEGSALRLVDSLVPPGALQPGVRARIADAAEGNPLYVEEFLDMLIDRGALVGDADAPGTALRFESVDTPPTIQALLAARLDRLDPGERAVVERASVVGRVFDGPSVVALVPLEERSDVPRHLAALVREEVLRLDRSGSGRAETYRFRHMLIRDAAYEGLPKVERADLHELFADWLVLNGAGRGAAPDEIVGYHLEQAYGLRSQFEPVDDRGRDLARRAAARLIAAGRRALARSDLAGTVNLLGRGVALLDAADPLRLEMLPDLGRALAQSGRHDESKACFVEATERTRAGRDERAHARARVMQTMTIGLRPGVPGAEYRRVADESIAVFERLPDDRGMAFAWRLHASVDHDEGRMANEEASLARALEYARRAGDHHQETTIAFELGIVLVVGPTPIPDAIRRCEEILAGAPDDRAIEMAMAHPLAHLRARLGDFEHARQLAARCQEILVGTGQLATAAFMAEMTWDVETVAGNIEAAEWIASEANDWFVATSDPHPLLEACVARSRAALRKDVDLERLAVAAAGQVGWVRAVLEGAMAEALVNEGRLADAALHAQTAVDILAGTEVVWWHADMAMVLGNVLRAAGRDDEADAAFREALDLCRRKGNVVGERTALERLAARPMIEVGSAALRGSARH